MKKRKVTIKRRAESQPKGKGKAAGKSKLKQSNPNPKGNGQSSKKPTFNKQPQKLKRKSVRPLKEYEVEVKGMRIEYVVILVSDSDKARLRKYGIPVESTEPYDIGAAFGAYSDTAWIADTVSAFAGESRVRVTAVKSTQYHHDYRKPDSDVIFGWIETDEYATAQVNACRVKDIALKLSKPVLLSLPDWSYLLSDDVAVVSPSESDIEYTGGGGGNCELMYIQKGGEKLDLVVDQDSDPRNTILRLA